MSPEVTLRDYQKEDYPAIAQLWEQLGLGGKHRGDTPEIIDNTIRLGGRLIVMQDNTDGSIIGTSWLTVDGRRTYLHHFGIAEHLQGKGLSRELLEYSLQIVRETGYQVKLEVHVANHVAVKLYKKYGFQRLGDYDVYIIREISKTG